MTWRRLSHSIEATQLAGEELASLLEPGDVVLLEGPLGAGKTAFTQGIGRGLRAKGRVTSPTFTVVRQHDCEHPRIKTLHHADVYRTNSLDEIVDLALGELVEEDAVAVVEWGEMAKPVLGTDVIQVVITVTGDDDREITLAYPASSTRVASFSTWGIS